MFNFDDWTDGQNVKPKPWMSECEFLLGTVENLDDCVDACIKNGRFGLDLETSGLDNRIKLIDGINQTVDKIAGVCISPDGVKGYYFPLKHKVIQKSGDIKPHPANIPLAIFSKSFQRLMDAVKAEKTVAIFHHGKFDQEFLEYNETGEPWGDWDNPKHWEDTMILGYLRNSRARNRRLKDMAAALPDAHSETQTGGPGLGMDMIEIYELFGHDKYEKDFNYDFTTLDPTEQQCLWYAGSDAICTYRLKDLLEPSVLGADSDGRTQSTIYKFEKACVAATRWMERNRIHVDRARTLELIQLGQKEWYDAVIKVYDEAEKILGRNVMPGVYRALQTFFDPNDPQQLLEDQLERARKMAKLDFPDPIANITNTKGDVRPTVYDINSPQQLGEMFDEMEVPGLKRTEKSGQIKTSKSEIERIVEETGDQFPFMDSIRWFREINKALSTYLYPLYTQTDPDDNTARINFRQDGTDTGRFTTPSKSGEPMIGWPQINVQSIPRASESGKHPDCLNRVRECISCRPGKTPKYMAAIDFSGEELRLITNLSREPKWLKEFFHCSGCDRMFDSGEGQETPMPPPARCPNCGSDKIGDIHTLTGLSVYGSDASTKSDWKELRGKAKCVHPDTLMVHNGQLIKMGSLPLGDIDTFLPVGGTTIGKDGETIPLLESYNGGMRPLFHVITDRGVITCTDQHRIQKADGNLCSISGEDSDILKPGTILQETPPIALGLGKPFPTLVISDNFEHECNKHTAFFTGVLQGCNTMTDKTVETFAKFQTDKVPIKEWPDDILRLCQALNIPTGRDLYLKEDFPDWRFGKFLGITPGLKGTGIPAWVLGAGRKALIPYLAGLWAASGKRTLITPHIWLASHVMAVLQALGIQATLARKTESWKITTSISYKTLLKGYLEGDLITKPFDGIKPPVVKAIIPAGEGPCVDIHVNSPDHLYWCNGLTSHNSLNFALCYGGGGSAAMRATGVDKQEGWRIKNTFDRSFDGLNNWWGSQHEFARKHGFVRTAFGRRYPVPDIRNPDGGFRAKAERNAVNGPIQGCLHSDCKIPTQDGIFTIKELWDRQETENYPDFQVWTGKGWSRARASYSGIKPLIITTLTDGRQIKTSPNHLFRCYTESGLQWVRQENLTPGTWVAINDTDSKQSSYSPDLLNHATCFLDIPKGVFLTQLELVERLSKPIPSELLKALDYSYLQVSEIQDMGQHVPMYDLEVFDEDHAFVCDGVIVHNSGADICKIAMTLVYRELKNRGWLDKVMLIMTMHDELVFEIDADVLEEIIPTLVDIMTRNKAVLGMKWPVPLTCDVEIGHDWTVPWHTTEMAQGEVRFIGNIKYKKPPDGRDWDSMQFYPDELTPWLKQTSKPDIPKPDIPKVVPTDSVVPDVAPGGEFIYQLKSPLTVGTLIKLADVINQCQNKGLATLKILTREGETLDGWDKDIRIKISPTTFHVLAQHYGI